MQPFHTVSTTQKYSFFPICTTPLYTTRNFNKRQSSVFFLYLKQSAKRKKEKMLFEEKENYTIFAARYRGYLDLTAGRKGT